MCCLAFPGPDSKPFQVWILPALYYSCHCPAALESRWWICTGLVSLDWNMTITESGSVCHYIKETGCNFHTKLLCCPTLSSRHVLLSCLDPFVFRCPPLLFDSFPREENISNRKHLFEIFSLFNPNFLMVLLQFLENLITVTVNKSCIIVLIVLRVMTRLWNNLISPRWTPACPWIPWWQQTGTVCKHLSGLAGLLWLHWQHWEMLFTSW